MRPGNPEREENVRTGSAGWQPEQAPCAGVCGQSKAEASCQRRAATVGSHRGDASFSKGLSSQAEAWAGGADGRLPPGERRLGLGGGEAPAQKAEGGVRGRPGPRASERHRAGAGPGGEQKWGSARGAPEHQRKRRAGDWFLRLDLRELEVSPVNRVIGTA